MNSDPTTRPDRGFFSTGRVMTWCALLIVAGLAVPSLKSGPGAAWMGKVTGVVSSARKGESMGSVRDTARTVATRSRMRGIVTELALWTGKFGLPESHQLTEVVGRSTATDAWGRRITFVPPTRRDNGWLRSAGPDSQSDTDDIYMPVTYKDLTRGKDAE